MNNEDSGENHDKYLVGCTIRKYTWKPQNIHDVNTMYFWVFLLCTCLDKVYLIIILKYSDLAEHLPFQKLVMDKS